MGRSGRVTVDFELVATDRGTVRVVTKVKESVAELGIQAEKTKKSMDSMGQQSSKAADFTERLGVEASKGSRNVEKMGESGKDAAVKIARLGGTAFAVNQIISGLTRVSSRLNAVILDVVNTSSVFEQKMANVGTLLSTDVQPRVKALSEAATTLSKTFGVTAEQLGLAAYQAVSAGLTDTKEATDALTGATKLSIGALGTMEESMRILAASTNAFGLSAGSVDDITNTLQLTVRQGVTTVGQLSQAFGAVASVASQAGISLREMSAATAALTTAGFDTATAQQNLRQAIVSILAPNAKMTELFRRLNVESGLSLIATDGLVGAFDRLRSVADDPGFLKEAIGRVQGFSAAMSLTGNQGDKFRETMALMSTEVGALNEAVGVATNTFEKAAERFQAAQDAFKIEVMEEASPIIIAVTDSLTELINRMTHALETSGRFGQALSVVVGATATFGVVALAAVTSVATFGLQFVLLWAALVQMSGGAEVAKTRIKGLLSALTIKPVLGAVSAIKALSRGIVFLINPFNLWWLGSLLVKGAMLALGAVTLKAVAIVAAFGIAITAAVALIYTMWKALDNLLGISELLGAAWTALTENSIWSLSATKAFIADLIGIGGALDETTESVKTFSESLEELGGGVFDELQDMVGRIREDLGGAIFDSEGISVGEGISGAPVEALDNFVEAMHAARFELELLREAGDPAANESLKKAFDASSGAVALLGDAVNANIPVMNELRAIAGQFRTEWEALPLAAQNAAAGIRENTDALKELSEEGERAFALEQKVVDAGAKLARTQFELFLKAKKSSDSVLDNQEQILVLARRADEAARAAAQTEVKSLRSAFDASFDKFGAFSNITLFFADSLAEAELRAEGISTNVEKAGAAIDGSKTELEKLLAIFKDIDTQNKLNVLSAEQSVALQGEKVKQAGLLKEGILAEVAQKKLLVAAEISALEVAKEVNNEKIRAARGKKDELVATRQLLEANELIDAKIASQNARLVSMVPTIQEVADSYLKIAERNDSTLALAESRLDVEESLLDVLEEMDAPTSALLEASNNILEAELMVLQNKKDIVASAYEALAADEKTSEALQLMVHQTTLLDLQMLKAKQNAKEFREELTGANFNLESAFGKAFDDLIKGIGQGTAEIEDIFENLGDSIKASITKAFADSLLKKFEFDDIFISNIFGLGKDAKIAGDDIGKNLGGGIEDTIGTVDDLVSEIGNLKGAADKLEGLGGGPRVAEGDFNSIPKRAGSGSAGAEVGAGASIGGVLQAAGVGIAVAGIFNDLGAGTVISSGVGGAAAGAVLGTQIGAGAGPIGAIIGAVLGIVVGLFLDAAGPSSSDLVRRHFDKFFTSVFEEFVPDIDIDRDLSRRGFNLQDERFTNFSADRQNQIQALAILASGTIDLEDVGAAKNYRIAVAQLTDGFDKGADHFVQIAQKLVGSLSDGTFGDAVETFVGNIKDISADLGRPGALESLAGIKTSGTQGSNRNFILARDADVIQNVAEGLEALFKIIFAEASDAVLDASGALSRRIEADVLRRALSGQVNFEEADPGRTAKIVERGVRNNDIDVRAPFSKLVDLFEEGKFSRDGEKLAGEEDFVQFLIAFSRATIQQTEIRGHRRNFGGINAPGIEGAGLAEFLAFLQENFLPGGVPGSAFDAAALPRIIGEALDVAFEKAGKELDPDKKDAFDIRLDELLEEFVAGSDALQSTADILETLNKEFGLDLQIDDFLDEQAIGEMAQRLAEIALQAFAIIAEGFGKAATQFLATKDMDKAKEQFALSLSEQLANEFQEKLGQVALNKGPFAGIQEEVDTLLGNLDRDIADILSDEDLTGPQAQDRILDIVDGSALQFENIAAQVELLGPAIERFAELQEKIVLAFTTFNQAADRIEEFQSNIKLLLLEFGAGNSLDILNEKVAQTQKEVKRRVSELLETRGFGDIGELSDEDLKRLVFELEAAANAVAEAGRAELAALEERLRLTQQWIDLLPRARDILRDIRGGGDQPDEDRARSFEIDASRLGSLIAQFNIAEGEQKASIAGRILDLAPSVLEQGRNAGIDISGVETVLDAVLTEIVGLGLDAESEALEIQKDILEVQNKIRTQLEFLKTNSDEVLAELRDRMGRDLEDIARDVGPTGPSEATRDNTKLMVDILQRGINVVRVSAKDTSKGFPHLANGGVFTADEGLAVLHGPEAVIPLDRMPEMRGETTLNQEMNITFMGDQSPRALSAEERFQLEREQRRMARDPSIRALSRR